MRRMWTAALVVAVLLLAGEARAEAPPAKDHPAVAAPVRAPAAAPAGSAGTAATSPVRKAAPAAPAGARPEWERPAKVPDEEDPALAGSKGRCGG